MFDIHKMRIIASLWMSTKIIPKHKLSPIIPVLESFKQDMFESANNPKKIIPDYCFPKSYIKKLPRTQNFVAQIM